MSAPAPSAAPLPVPAGPEIPAPIPESLSPAPACPTPAEPAKPQEKQPHPEALGRSVGGHSTKIHAVCDALGLPIRFVLSGGEVHDSKMARALIDGLAAEYLLADKGYDSRSLVAAALCGPFKY